MPTYFSFVSSSTGNIKINTAGASTGGQQVQAGGNINLYFGGVTWSGEQFYLFLSQDSSTQISSGLVYTPTFSVYDVADTTAAHNYTGDNGIWVTGNNWVNGSMPSTIGLGNYYIKAIDQVGSTTAVTDTYITVNPIAYNAILTISPPAGPGGVPITFTGSGYPPSQNITISYRDPTFNTWNYLTSVRANATGQISASSEAPDLMKTLGTYDSPETYTSISYRSELGTQILSSASYNEYQRGLKTVGNSTANGLYGNGTNLVSQVRVMAGDTIALSGKWFNPGPIYVRWDGVNIVGTVSSSEWLNANIICTTATNATGYFSTTVTIPAANAGEHYLAVEDSQTRITVKIFMSTASLQLSPASGPGGATVQFSGSKYPPSTSVDVYYKDPAFSAWNYWTSTSSDSEGKISFSTEMPDLKQYSYSGDSNYSSALSFRTQVSGVAYSYADYREFARGLQQVGSKVANAIFGNGTDLSSSVSVKPGDSLFISGKWFHPGIVYIKFDGVSVVGTVTGQEWQSAQVLSSTTASQAGAFQVYVTIPTASGGVHYLAIEDTQTKLITRINVISSYISPTPSPTVSPTSNPTSNPTPIPTPNPSLPTPSIDVSCKSTNTVTGFKVEIDGKLSLNGNPLSDQPVLISYSVTGGNSWQSLTLLKTLSDGRFVAVWTPSVNGNYLIKATVESSSTMNGASEIINLALTPDAEQNVFTLTSNSTITQFAFNSTSKELGFIAEGPSDTIGYVHIYIPKTIISDISTLKTYVDGNEVSFNSESQTDSWLISFSYSHSQHTITMTMSEALQVSNPNTDSLPQWLLYTIPAALVVAIAVIAVVFKSRTKKSPY
ncbi:MAG: hypothetical protein M1490_04390 [Candidatus Bathyarchaeota archaeon]|nr:hypothetical protein [Candidatus Bathyarchaeota archaeon]